MKESDDEFRDSSEVVFRVLSDFEFRVRLSLSEDEFGQNIQDVLGLEQLVYLPG